MKSRLNCFLKTLYCKITIHFTCSLSGKHCVTTWVYEGMGCLLVVGMEHNFLPFSCNIVWFNFCNVNGVKLTFKASFNLSSLLSKLAPSGVFWTLKIFFDHFESIDCKFEKHFRSQVISVKTSFFLHHCCLSQDFSFSSSWFLFFHVSFSPEEKCGWAARWKKLFKHEAVLKMPSFSRRVKHFSLKTKLHYYYFFSYNFLLYFRGRGTGWLKSMH